MRALQRAGLLIAALMVLAQPAAADAVPDNLLPVPYGTTAVLDAARNGWDGPVAGANNYNCKPSAEHPEPVVLVTSTYLSDRVNWTALAPYLHNQGYCVFTLNYGRQMFDIAPGLNGMDPLPMSSREVADTVDRVLVATGARKVDLVGHSQGGVVARLYINTDGGTEKVNRMILLSSPYTVAAFGTDLTEPARNAMPKSLYDAINYNGVIPTMGLNILDPWALGAMQPLQPNIRYSQITNIIDFVNFAGNVVAPAGAPNATTEFVNDICPTDFSQHFVLPASPTVVAMIGNALDPAHPVVPPCTVIPLVSP